jgi:hypothetical protein
VARKFNLRVISYDELACDTGGLRKIRQKGKNEKRSGACATGALGNGENDRGQARAYRRDQIIAAPEAASGNIDGL